MTDPGSIMETDPAPSSSPPWYIMLLFGVGGWIAGLFAAGFVFALAEALFSSEFRAVFVVAAGVVMLIAALALVRRLVHPFARQFLNAAAVGGHAVILIGIIDIEPVRSLVRSLGGAVSEFTLIVVVSVAIVTLFYAVYPDRVHRFITALWAASLLAVYALFEFESTADGVHAVFLIEVATLMWLFRRPVTGDTWRPLAFAAVLACLLTPIMVLVPDHFVAFARWPMDAIATGALLALLWSLRRDYAGLTGGFLVAMVVLSLAVGALTTPGLTVALVILLIGYWQDEIVLKAAGIVFVPVYMIVYYYDLDVDLLSKSLLLIAAGVVFIAGRKVLDSHVARLERGGEVAP